jgi:putative tryptophan/tyrosine transport system substrate-binding protein
MLGIRRRDLITLLGGTAATWPFMARAQQSAIPLIGFLGAESADLYAARLRSFHEGLRETGSVEGRNLALEYRWAEGRYDQFPALLADLISRKVAVIVAVAGNPPALAAKAATSTIPILFVTSDNPVATGLVASLSRPGGNITGVTSLAVELGAKQLDVLHELVPTARIIALLVNPTSPNRADTLSRELQTVARIRGLELHVIQASSESDLDAAFATLPGLRADALVVGADPFFNSRPQQLATLAARQGVPTMYPYRDYVAAGGLISYGDSVTDLYRKVAGYAVRILKGEKPADLPVQQSTKIELFINLKTSNALGIAVPVTLLGRADEVIE